MKGNLVKSQVALQYLNGKATGCEFSPKSISGHPKHTFIQRKNIQAEMKFVQSICTSANGRLDPPKSKTNTH